MNFRLLTPVSRLYFRRYVKGSSSSTTAPPMLLKIRQDIKAAMQARDSNRLSVLRSLLTQTMNASKTSSPITTDVQILALLRKGANASRIASAEFKAAGRQDLAEKEDSQLKIMDEYARSVETVNEEEVRLAIMDVLSKMKADGAKIQMGEVLKRVFAPAILGEKPVERAQVVQLVKSILAT